MRNPIAKDAAFVGIGSNLPSRLHGPPLATCRAAAAALAEAGFGIIGRSRWYLSRPVPFSGQPPFINGVVALVSPLAAPALLSQLHGIEAAFGRTRSFRNAARVLDLDLIARGEEVVSTEGGLILPHPRMHERGFVLKPMAEIAPEWRHPRLGVSIAELIARTPPGQHAEPVADG